MRRQLAAGETLGHFMGDGSLPYVAGVSWPRSGHHLLKRILSELLGTRFGYCEFYEPQANPQLRCCAAFPCARAGAVSFTKQHDFEGTATLPPDVPLIVQTRDFLPAVVSHYEVALLGGEPDTAEAFRRFAFARAAPYRHFCDKWVRSPRAHRVVLPYETLVAAPGHALATVLSLYGVRFEPAALAGVLERTAAVSVRGQRWTREGRGVRDRRDVTRFRHYDPALFAKLARRAGCVSGAQGALPPRLGGTALPRP